MEILYFGTACDREWFNKISEYRKISFNVAQYMFEMALIEGFSKIDNANMKIYYFYQDAYYPKGYNLFFSPKNKKLNEKYSVQYLLSLNLPIIKEILNIFLGLFITLKWIIKNRKKKNKIVLTSFNYPTLSLGIYIITNMFNIKRANMFPDLSQDTMSQIRQKNMIWLKRVILPFYKKLIYKIDTSYDYYILFTKAMNKKVNPKNKPYLTIEGIYQDNLNLSIEKKERAIMYAGTLSAEYGLKMLLDAFKEIRDDGVQLWLFGNGDMNGYIEQASNIDRRIKYFGFKPREEVFKYEKKATLLINMRNPNDEYTKYSFPSKTFEYMVSGTPFLTTWLEGIPEEYYNYLYVIKEYNVDNIRKKIEEILRLPQNELNDFGNRARKFILENKNNTIQTNRIYNFLTNKKL